MGNDLVKITEQAQKGGEKEEPGTVITVNNVKKKIKSAHVKVLAAKLPDRTHLFSALNCLAEVQLARGDPMGAASAASP